MNARLRMTVCLGALLALSAPMAGVAKEKDTPRTDQDRTDAVMRASNEKPVTGTDADNTRVNERDDGGGTRTPDDQSNQSTDLKVLADVRKAITDDDSLSTLAHNVKIMAENGVVTLRGPVNGTDEKEKVAKIAQRIAGVSRVNNELDVKK